jgi:serine/threonine protein kinase/WD40 repeat protein
MFVAAVKVPPDHWRVFLKEACAGDDELHRQVGDLLQEHQQAGTFLDRPAACFPEVNRQESGVSKPNLVAVSATPDPCPLTPCEEPGTVIGPYKLLELIGEGGMGAVWMAEQREPIYRKVALKVLKAGMDTRQVVARFEAERQALALMDHTNIAKVLDGGTTACGRPYFVMELVKGTPITRYCDEQQLTPRERLELFLPVCRAIQHAHTKGIIHRDIKPANVLVAPYDGRPVPKVIDFGVAKAVGQRLTERTLFTGFGAVVGTLEYMSPEQAELNNQDIDTRSDIYALGVLLYELLTGTTPLSHERLKQAAFTETLRLIREEDPPRPSTRLSESKNTLPAIAARRHTEPARLAKLVRGELDWLVMKALEKDRNRRYETANGLAKDVQRYLMDEPVRACPPTVGYRLRKFARRNKRPMAAVSLVLLALVAGIIGTSWGLVSAERALSELQDQEAETRAAEREKTLQLAHARWNEARLSRQARQPGQRYHGLDALGETVRHLRSLGQLEDHRLGLRNDTIAALTLWDVRLVKRHSPQPGCPSPVLDRKYYATADGPSVVCWRRCVDDKIVHRWQWAGLPCLFMDISPDGRYVAAFCGDTRQCDKNAWRVWDSETGSLVLERATPNWSHAFRPDGKVLAMIQADGSVALCDLESGRDLPPLPAGPDVKSLCFHPKEQYLAVSSDRPVVEVWNLATGKVLFHLDGARYWRASLAWSPDGDFLAVGSRDTCIYVCMVRDRKVQAVLRGHENIVTGLEFHPSGRLLASSSHDDTTRLWSFSPGGELVLPGELLQGFSRDGRRMFTGSRQGAISEWQVADPGDCLHYLPHGEGRSPGVWGIAFAPDGRLLASASPDGVLLWDAATAHLVGQVPSGFGEALAFHPRQRCLFTTGPGGWMQWPIAPEHDGQVVRVGPGSVVRPASSDSRSLRLDVAATGESLLVGAGDGNVDLVSLAAPGNARRMGKHDGLGGVSLSADGRWAASTNGPDNTVNVWDVARGTLVRCLSFGRDNWCSATFSPDSRWLVIGVRSHLYFYEVGSWERKAELPRDPRSLFSYVAFTRDGTLLALAQGRNCIDLHNAATLRHLARLEISGPATVTGLSLSPDGTRLAATTDCNVIALWDLRRLRQALAALDLDWDLASYSPAVPNASPAQLLTVEVIPAERH